MLFCTRHLDTCHKIAFLCCGYYFFLKKPDSPTTTGHANDILPEHPRGSIWGRGRGGCRRLLVLGGSTAYSLLMGPELLSTGPTAQAASAEDNRRLLPRLPSPDSGAVSPSRGTGCTQPTSIIQLSGTPTHQEQGGQGGAASPPGKSAERVLRLRAAAADQENLQPAASSPLLLF